MVIPKANFQQHFCVLEGHCGKGTLLGCSRRKWATKYQGHYRVLYMWREEVILNGRVILSGGSWFILNT